MCMVAAIAVLALAAEVFAFGGGMGGGRMGGSMGGGYQMSSAMPASGGGMQHGSTYGPGPEAMAMNGSGPHGMMNQGAGDSGGMQHRQMDGSGNRMSTTNKPATPPAN